MDARRLYLREGCSSLSVFTYCTQVLHLSEHAAYGRIEATRTARRFPVILDLLAEGSITLTAVRLLAPHLTTENHLELFKVARHRSKREIEHLVARLRPPPDVASLVRMLPTSRAHPARVRPVDNSRLDDGASSAAAIAPPTSRPPIVGPLAPDRYKVQLTVSGKTYEKLRRAQDLSRHTIPNGDAAAIFDRALTLLLEELSRTKLAATERPRRASMARARSRRIPAAVRREVWARDGGRCAFVGTNGRCTETGFVEFHHVVPYAEGGQATVQNIGLRCRAHNAFELEKDFGPLLVREAGNIVWMSPTRSGPSSAISRQDGPTWSRSTRVTGWDARRFTVEPPTSLEIAGHLYELRQRVRSHRRSVRPVGDGRRSRSVAAGFDGRSKAGARHVLSVPAVQAVATDVRLVRIAGEFLGQTPVPFRATLFEKSRSANWLVVWHQDTALPLRERVDSVGCGPWSSKVGVLYAHAPASALEMVVALRVHLDDSTDLNGPLRVLPETHVMGVLTDDEIERLATSVTPVDCIARAGGVVAMRPLIVHSSSKSRSADPRRVLHVEYASSLTFDGRLQLAVG